MLDNATSKQLIREISKTMDEISGSAAEAGTNRIDVFLESIRLGIEGNGLAFVEAAHELTPKVTEDLTLFTGYLALAKTKCMLRGVHSGADIYQLALELFALGEQRAFHYAYKLNERLKEARKIQSKEPS